jgi:hypothetical protein
VTGGGSRSLTSHRINALQTMSVIPSRKQGCDREGRVKTQDTAISEMRSSMSRQATERYR